MAFDVDEEILQDFLIEAGEILELLQEQLVSLENNPEDTDLLNAIFRGFHTVKGGAGFLGLAPWWMYATRQKTPSTCCVPVSAASALN